MMSNHRSAHPLAALLMAIAAVGAGALAQYLRLHGIGTTEQIVLLWLLSALAFTVAFLMVPSEVLRPRLPLPATQRPVNWLWLLPSLAFALLTWQQSSGNRFRLLGVGAWLLCLLTFTLAVAPPAAPLARLRRWWQAHRGGWRLRIDWATVALAALLLLALAVRIHRLDAVPIEGNSDHYEKLLDVNDVLTGRPYVFFERNTGREPMQFYLTAAIIRLFDTGLTHFSLKLSNLVMGMLTVGGVYLLGREVGGRRLGLFAAFFAAVSFWVIAPSRVGLRYPFAPAWSALSLWGLMRAIHRQDRGSWLLAGLLLGAGLHGYTAHRIVPLAATVIVLLHALFDDERRLPWRQWATHFAIYVVTALILFLPLMRYMVDNPESFWGRSLTRTTSMEQTVAGNPLLLFEETMRRTLGQFHWTGDEVYVAAVRQLPALDEVSAVLLIGGLLYLLLVLMRRQGAVALSLLIGTLILLLPSALNLAFPSESPSTVRSGSAVPFIAMLVALPLPWLLDRLRDGLSQRKAFVASGLLLIALLLPMSYSNLNRYFGRYAQEYQLRAMNVDEIGDNLVAFLPYVGDEAHIWGHPLAYWIDFRGFSFRFGDTTWHIRNVIESLEQLLSRVPRDGQPLLFILKQDDQAAIGRLHAEFPEGDLILYESRAGEAWDYAFFIVPPKDTIHYRQLPPPPFTADTRPFERVR